MLGFVTGQTFVELTGNHHHNWRLLNSFAHGMLALVGPALINNFCQLKDSLDMLEYVFPIGMKRTSVE